jgi:hypothetical protein
MKARITEESSLISQIRCIGNIKVGEKTDKGFPTSLDYFKATGPYANKFEQTLGKPDKLEITFFSDDIHDVCYERFEIRTAKNFDGIGGKLFAQSDGEEFKIYSKDKPPALFNIKEHPEIKNQIKERCKGVWYRVLTLRFIILKMTGIFGVWQFTTRGKETSIKDIRNTFDYVQEHAGTVVNIPFDLIVKKVTSQRPGSRNSYPIVSLIPNLSKNSIDLVKEIKDQNIGLITEDKLRSLEIEYETQS